MPNGFEIVEFKVPTTAMCEEWVQSGIEGGPVYPWTSPVSEVRKELPDLKTPEFVPDKVRLVETRVRPGNSGVLLIYEGERKPDVPTPRIEIEQFLSPPANRSVRIEAPPGGYEKVTVNGSDGYLVRGMPVVMTRMDGTRKIVTGCEWRDDVALRLMFFKNGAFVRFFAFPATAWTRDDLIRMAASLGPRAVSARR